VGTVIEEAPTFLYKFHQTDAFYMINTVDVLQETYPSTDSNKFFSTYPKIR